MGVLNMARSRQTATTATATRAPRKPAGRVQHPTGLRPAEGQEWPGSGSQGDHGQAESLRRHRPPSQRRPGSQGPGSRPGRPDLGSGDVRRPGEDEVVGHRSGSDQAGDAGKARQAHPADKGQATGNGVSFSGRPTTKAETVAARVKQAGLRIRADADVDAIVARLRATPARSRHGWLPATVRRPSNRPRPRPSNRPRQSQRSER
jgi:hypothetical protein